jgi:Kef-type K+ transport system membrane component KefB
MPEVRYFEGALFLGVYSVFGGFVLGVAIPRGVLARDLKQKIEPFALGFLLPMFFTFSGLNTQLKVWMDPAYLIPGLAILIASVLGKGVACWGAARLSGEDQETSLAVRTLMATPLFERVYGRRRRRGGGGGLTGPERLIRNSTWV